MAARCAMALAGEDRRGAEAERRKVVGCKYSAGEGEGAAGHDAGVVLADGAGELGGVGATVAEYGGQTTRG